MPSFVIPTIILGSAIIVVIVFLAKSVFTPKRIASLADYVKQGKNAAAVRLAKQLLQKDSRNGELHYLLGKAYLNDDKPELALMELKTVNQIGQFGGHLPEAEFRKTIAKLYRRFGQTEEALKEYLVLMKLEPNEADHYFESGQLFEDREKTDRAIEFYRKAIEIDERHSASHFRLGYLLYRGKHSVEAKQELETAIKYGPENYKAHYYLGRILKENRDYVAALVSFEKAQRDQSFKVKALVERGSCYMSLNSLDKAVTELERALRLVEQQTSAEALYARYFLSLCYEKMRKFENAIEQWEAIYAKKPSFRDVAEKLSQYQDLRSDDKMKDFLTAGYDEFAQMCNSIVEALELTPRDTKSIPNGCEIIAVEAESKFRNTRKMPRIVRVLRLPEVIDQSTIRALHEDMKKMNVMRGMIIASTRFSRSATEFAETRPIELIDKDKLQKLLKKIPLYESSSN